MCHNHKVIIRSYRDKGTYDIARKADTKEARKTLPSHLHPVARRKLAYLAAVETLEDLKGRKGLGLHALKGDRAGQYSIMINDQYRICFIWTGKFAERVEITDYH